MCVCSWHSSQISWKSCTHRTPPMRGMRGLDRLIVKPNHSSTVYSTYMHKVMYAHTHTTMRVHTYCVYALWRQCLTLLCTVCIQQCMYGDIRGSIIQNITLIPNSHSVPTQFNFAPFSAVIKYIKNILSCLFCCINILHNISLISSSGGLTVNIRAWITFSVVFWRL